MDKAWAFVSKSEYFTKCIAINFTLPVTFRYTKIIITAVNKKIWHNFIQMQKDMQ